MLTERFLLIDPACIQCQVQEIRKTEVIWGVDVFGEIANCLTFGLRNPVEQWFGIFKHRINLFYNRWPHNAPITDAQS